MMGLRVPIVSVIIGEGCSGGALGVGVADRHGMLENAYYAVISPEGCAAILFHDAEKATEAAAAMRLTARDMLEFRVVDEIIPEPPGGAHRDAAKTAENIKAFLCRTLDELAEVPTDELLDRRYQRYRALGTFRQVVPEKPD
jgi:acetyl-CoA carboxylase carboxyl transferase subunit alpha